MRLLNARAMVIVAAVVALGVGIFLWVQPEPWGTGYENSSYNYSLRYPRGWEIVEETSESLRVQSPDFANEGDSVNSGAFLRVTVVEGREDVTDPLDWYEETMPDYDIMSIEPLQIKGRQVTQFVAESGEPPRLWQGIFFNKAGTVYVVELRGTGLESIADIYDRIAQSLEIR